MDLMTLINTIREEGDIERLIRNPLAQFGNARRQREYLGARLLPERLVGENILEEEDTKFRSVIAEDSGRYDPAQKRKRSEAQEMQISLGHFDIKREIDGREYDAILRLLNSQQDNAARTQMISLIDRLLFQALLDKKELQRWQAMVDAEVTVTKTNGQQYTVQLEDPTGHRFMSGGFWNDDTFDPFEAIFQGANLLKDAGFEVAWAITNYTGVAAMRNNEQIRTRTGGMTVDTVNNAVTPVRGIPTNARINSVLGEQGIPPITEYNLGYYTETTYEKFLRDGVFVMIGRTPREEVIARENGEDLLLFSTLGYYAVGTPQGKTSAGDVIKIFPKEDKPVRIEGEAYGVGFPVPLESYAMVVIDGILP